MYKCQRVLSPHGFHAKLTQIDGQFADQLSLQLENRVVHLAMPQSKLFVGAYGRVAGSWILV